MSIVNFTTYDMIPTQKDCSTKRICQERDSTTRQYSETGQSYEMLDAPGNKVDTCRHVQPVVR